MFVLSCTQWDATVTNPDGSTGACTAQAWVDQPGLLPALPVDSGLLIASTMITTCAAAWGLKMVRRFIWPRA